LIGTARRTGDPSRAIDQDKCIGRRQILLAVVQEAMGFERAQARRKIVRPLDVQQLDA
jgi:hypothetical protein